MDIPIRVLVIEDSEDDALLTIRELKKGGFKPEWRIVDTPQALENALDEEQWDIILSDYQMPAFSGRDALHILHDKGIDLPFIVISGILIEENAVEILKAGANDYVKKGNWARLIPAVGRELREAESRRERMLAQQERTKAEEQYHTLFETAVEGIFQSTPTGRFINVNPAMARLYGFDSPKELIDNVSDISLQLYVHSSNRKSLLEMVTNTGTASGFKAEFYRKDGSCIWLSINARGVFNESGKLELIEGFAVDITKRKEAEDELAEMNRELERIVAKRTIDLERKALELEQANLRLKEVDQLKTAFLSSVSHELRTPLTSVLGFAKLIHRDFCGTFLPNAQCDIQSDKMGKRICSNLDIIVQEGERLTRLVNDFLDLTRIEAGRMKWDDRIVETADILMNAANAVTGLFTQNPDVELKLEIPNDLPDWKVDPDRITQVVINLLNNAAKFTPKGHVVLRAKFDPHLNTIELQVEDTGMGIPPDDLDKIFNKFHQVKGVEAMDVGNRGSGLGLSISSQIVEHYGSSIRVESQLGKGSIFFMTFPLANAADRTDWE